MQYLKAEDLEICSICNEEICVGEWFILNAEGPNHIECLEDDPNAEKYSFEEDEKDFRRKARKDATNKSFHRPRRESKRMII